MLRKRREFWQIVVVVIASLAVSRALKHFGGRQAQLLGLGVLGVVLLTLWLLLRWNVSKLNRYRALRRKVDEER